MEKLLVLSDADVHELMPVRDCIPVMERALVALARGEGTQPLRTAMRPKGANGLLGMMPAYWREGFGLKAICVFPGNPARGLDSHMGAVLLFAPDDGRLLAAANASAVTAIRTAAVSAVATRTLGRPDSRHLAILGTGVQARSHLEAMNEVMTVDTVRVAGRTFERAEEFAEREGGRYEFGIRPVRTAAEAVEGADVIVTVTNSATPVLRREWIREGAHVNLVGSSSVRAREADGPTMAAGPIFVDRRESTLNESADYLEAVREGFITEASIRAELGEVLAGTARGRANAAEVTIFKSLGVGIEDLAAVDYLYRKAGEVGRGSWVPWNVE